LSGASATYREDFIRLTPELDLPEDFDKGRLVDAGGHPPVDVNKLFPRFRPEHLDVERQEGARQSDVGLMPTLKNLFFCDID
jgi:hypothetical protein